MLTAAPIERATRALRIGGLTPLSTADWPGQLAAVVFCQGCPWRCGYCHNPHLLPARAACGIVWEDVLAFLYRRKGLLDAVVFSGGEPLAQARLGDAIDAVRRMRFRIGLHTGGAYPRRLADVLPLVDWVGFDVKAPFADYAAITGVPGSGADALATARLVIDRGVACEFRTTVHPRLLEPATLARLAHRLADIGVRHYVLQEFRARGCVELELPTNPRPSFLSDAYTARLASWFESFDVRRA